MTHYDMRLVTRRPSQPLRVFVNDKETSKFTVAADDENGWVEVYITDKDGNPKLFGSKTHQHLKTKVLRGVVRFEEMEETE